MKSEADYDHATTRPLLLCFSAHDRTTLARNIAAIGNVAPRYFTADLAFTLNTRRTRFSQGAFTVVREGKEIEAFGENALRYGVAGKEVPAVGYLLTGQGVRRPFPKASLTKDLMSSGAMGRHGRGSNEHFPFIPPDDSQIGSSPRQA